MKKVFIPILAIFILNTCSLVQNDDNNKDNEKVLLLAAASMNANKGASTCSTPNYSTPTTTTSSTAQYKVPDTAQTDCFNSTSGAVTACSGTGYDADYNTVNQQSYTDNGNQTITDNVTGLMWSKSPDINGDGTVNASDKKTQTAAVSYCSDLSLGGYTDWRLPDIKTLYSLMNFTGKDPSGSTTTSTASPFIDSTKFIVGFGDTSAGERFIDGQYATTSIYNSCTNLGGGYAETMFGVNFVDGRIKGYPTSNKTYYVYCVRGNTNYGLNNFVDNNDETISDKATSLMWQKNDTKSTDFENAVSTCEKATTGGHSDWRLPNVKELQSIVDYSRSPDITNSAAIDAKFNATSFTNEGGKTDYGYYWSSTTHAAYNQDGSSYTGYAGSYVCFGRCLGYIGSVYDVHGAGAQRSNYKQDVSLTLGASSAKDTAGNTFYYHGPQGDILRNSNMVRCVRNF
ncbi:MAG: DUF1566 domain-containing protein [Leptospiraceae bacterium]|nr:DUF1566 domain-containing protein [Leptospiraceae bacterium]